MSAALNDRVPTRAFETIRLDIADNVATITLDRPEKLNAISLGLLKDLHAALKSLLHRDDVRALLLTGEGRSFSAGVDLTAPKPGVNPNDPDEMLRDHHLPMFQLLRELPIPTIAAVNGPVIGAGLSLALNCDIVLAARSAYFLAAFVNLGLGPDTGASWLLQRALGDTRARAMLLLGQRVPAEQAEAWGMIWRVLDDDALMDEARAMALSFGRGPRIAHREIKRLMRTASVSSWRDHVLAEGESQAVARATEDAREARLAFREKRKPVFVGR